MIAINSAYDEAIGGDLQVGGKDILKLIWPIGRGFIDFTDNDYSTYLGLSWEKTSIGKFPVGKDTSQTEFNTVGKTGGSKTHTLTVDEMPSHNHGIIMRSTGINSFYQPYPPCTGPGDTTISTDGPIQNAGGGQAHNNLPPYQVVNYWKRIA